MRPAARRRIAIRKAAEQAAAAARQRRRRQLSAGLVVAGVVLVVAVTIVVQTARTSVDADSAVPANIAAGTAGAFAVGQPDAPVVVDLYEDFQCPACRQFEEATGDTVDDLVDDGSIQVRYHPIAILDRFSTDDYSTRSANAAAVVADEAGPAAFGEFHRLLYDQQPAEGGPGLTDDELVSTAAAAGASGTDVEDAIRNLRYGDWVQTVADQASRDGITGTPTILVDGEVLQDRSAVGLIAAVEAAGAA